MTHALWIIATDSGLWIALLLIGLHAWAGYKIWTGK